MKKKSNRDWDEQGQENFGEGKKDKSVRVEQRNKISNLLNIREFNWTEKQKKFFEIAQRKETRIMFVEGPAGCSKSLCAIYCLLTLLNNKKISNILYLRSAVESSEKSLGYMPGTKEDKLHDFGLVLFDKLYELLTKSEVDGLVKDNRIIVDCPNHARGRTYSVCGVCVDETQSMTEREIYTLLTRLGKYSKCFVLGDTQQSDLPKSKQGGFYKIMDYFCDEEGEKHGIYKFKFTEEDIMRDELTKFIVKRYTYFKNIEGEIV